MTLNSCSPASTSPLGLPARAHLRRFLITVFLLLWLLALLFAVLETELRFSQMLGECSRVELWLPSPYLNCEGALLKKNLSVCMVCLPVLICAEDRGQHQGSPFAESLTEPERARSSKTG